MSITKIIGFDSAWTNNPKKPGAICSISYDRPNEAEFVEPSLVTFEQALEFTETEKRTSERTIVAIDQPTIVPNSAGSRPVDKVAGSLISFIGGGVQPANRSKIGMFDDNAPIWWFKKQLAAIEDPEASRTATNGLYIMEVFPALALPALEPAFHGRLKGPKYNPANQKFRREDWEAVLRTVAEYGRRRGISGIAQWADDLSKLPIPRKADQDRLDAIVCAIVGYHWLTNPRDASIMIGDLSSGYMIAPVSMDTQQRLSEKAKQIGASVNASAYKVQTTSVFS